MPIRIAAIDVSHWHSVYDAAYLKQLMQIEDVELVAAQDQILAVAARRAEAVGGCAVYEDYRTMLRECQPDLVIALGRHDQMTEAAHYLLDHGFAFLMEKPMGRNAIEVAGIAAKASSANGFAAVPLPQRRAPFMRKAQEMLASGQFGRLSHCYIPYESIQFVPLSGMGFRLDARPGSIGRRFPS